LDEYFGGGRSSFDIPLDISGTPFQMSVWRALLLIPYGTTWSYGRLAAQIGRPKASRAVGGANHNNPVSIIVPCHRVIGSNGSMTGYGGGIWRKEWLLAHESGSEGK
jgi:methylated-DNA-[protein]-cysteine S-methyltransferase